jgi:hypothetical protein
MMTVPDSEQAPWVEVKVPTNDRPRKFFLARRSSLQDLWPVCSEDEIGSLRGRKVGLYPATNRRKK